MKSILTFLLVSFFLLLPKSVFAYSLEEVSDHNSNSDCWVVFDDNVYDITKYIAEHDRYLDIRGWCGEDMTEDFKDKDGEGIDHKNSSYALLESYMIGSIDDVVIESSDTQNENVATVVAEKDVIIDTSNKPSEYNLLVPVLVSLLLYWLVYFFVRSKNFLGISILRFNGFFNTILFLTLLIPSFGFGVFMILRTRIPSLYDIDFEFLYWHVELSLVMGTLAVSHFVQRFVIYTKQILK